MNKETKIRLTEIEDFHLFLCQETIECLYNFYKDKRYLEACDIIVIPDIIKTLQNIYINHKKDLNIVEGDLNND